MLNYTERRITAAPLSTVWLQNAVTFNVTALLGHSATEDHRENSDCHNSRSVVPRLRLNNDWHTLCLKEKRHDVRSKVGRYLVSLFGGIHKTFKNVS